MDFFYFINFTKEIKINKLDDKTFNNFLNTSSVLLEDKDYMKFLKYFACNFKNVEVPRFENNNLILKEKQHLLKNEGFTYEKIEIKINKEIDELIEKFNSLLLEMNFNSSIPKQTNEKYQINIIYKYKNTILKKVYLTIDEIKNHSWNNYLSNYMNLRDDEYSTIYTTKRKWYLYSEPYIKTSKFIVKRSNKPHIDFYDIVENLYTWFLELIRDNIVDFSPEKFIKDFNDFKARNKKYKYLSDLWDEYSPNTKKKEEIYKELIQFGLWNTFISFINSILSYEKSNVFFNYNEFIIKNYFIKNNKIFFSSEKDISNLDILELQWKNFVEFCEERADFRIPDFSIGMLNDDEDDSLIKYIFMQYNLFIRFQTLNNEYLNDKKLVIDSLTLLNKIYDSGKLDNFINKIEEIKIELNKIIMDTVFESEKSNEHINKYILAKIIEKIEFNNTYLTDIIQIIINNKIDKTYIENIENYRNNEIFNFLFNSYKPIKLNSIKENISYHKIIRDIHKKIKKIN
ncbi:hypothetical protein DP067_02850 [Mycoplasmopsis anatis]|nr:hypothetical protein DP067_02850 [Mycoplasmopsis anatis]VEU74067.1 Uncharacterised protein [Mycoplasmopsis anatis]